MGGACEDTQKATGGDGAREVRLNRAGRGKGQGLKRLRCKER